MGAGAAIATSVVEFLPPAARAARCPGVLEVCVNRPGELLVETVRGRPCQRRDDQNAACRWPPPWPPSATSRSTRTPLLAVVAAQRRAHSVRHPAGGAARHGVDHGAQAVAPDQAVGRLRTRRTVRAHGDGDAHAGREPVALRARTGRAQDAGRYAEFLRLACASTRPSSSAARPARARPPS